MTRATAPPTTILLAEEVEATGTSRKTDEGLVDMSVNIIDNIIGIDSLDVAAV